MRDLFEDIRKALRCEYISDMRFGKYTASALQYAVNLCMSNYDLSQWEDFVDYLFEEKIHFENYKEVSEYLVKKKNTDANTAK